MSARTALIIGAALRRYERARSARTRGVVTLSRRIASVTTTRRTVVRWLRDGAIQLLPDAALVKTVWGTGMDPHHDLRAAPPD